jgi:hypothetical protein
MWIYRAFSSTVCAKYSIARTGTSSTQALNVVAVAVETLGNKDGGCLG